VAVLFVAAALIVVLAGAYGVLVLTTANQPGPAALPSRPPASGGAFSLADPGGRWVVDPDGRSFVGYRAKELLAVDFVASPNEAVGRTSDVHGSLDIAGTQLRHAEITANVAAVRSDDDMRDQHVAEGLNLAAFPTATFVAGDAINLGTVTKGASIDADIAGMLTIHGATKPVTAKVKARWDGNSIAIAGSMPVHRADFGLEMPQLLGFRVADNITIEFELTFVPSCAPACVALAPPASAPAPSATSAPTPSPGPSASGKLASTSGQLAFAGVTDHGASAPSTAEIYLMAADGSGLRQLTSQGQFAEYPTWSPDGQWIAYTLRSEDQELGLWVVPARGGTPRRVTEQAARHPAWSPDGGQIAFVTLSDVAGELFVVAPDGANLHRLALPTGSIDHPAWSPDSRTLTFTFFPPNGNRESIYAAGADGDRAHSLIESGTYSYAASWARDGRTIVFVSDGNVATAAADGSRIRVLTSGRAVDRPNVSPDGSRIVFTQNDGLWIMNADGTAATHIELRLDYAGFASWNPAPR
jgi:polyisoprenoid-binding protein YceI/dipeptidyl aminopeptidase/acylaminoacyl peptidase